jgi:hypothetical protein
MRVYHNLGVMLSVTDQHQAHHVDFALKVRLFDRLSSIHLW